MQNLEGAQSPRGDVLRRSLTADGEAVVIAADATRLVQESMQRIQAWPPSMLHLGQAMLSAALIQALPDHRDDERLELQWRAEGPFGGMFVESREGGLIRGSVFVPQADVADLHTPLGPGLLQVRRIRRTATTGIVNCVGDVTRDVLDYLEKSEQKNCALYLWVDIRWDDRATGPHPFSVQRALGFLLHVLPQKTEERMNQLLYRWNAHLTSLGPISKWVLGPDPSGDVLSFVTGEFKPGIILERDLSFFCTCTEERAERALFIANSPGIDGEIPAPPTEAEQLARVRCEFCGHTYLLKEPGQDTGS